MPLVTHAPVPLGDVTDFTKINSMAGPPDGGLGCGFQFGPWYIPGGLTGPAWYAITIPLQVNNAVAVYKSTDDRATFQFLKYCTVDITQLWGTWFPGSGTILTMVVTRTADGGTRPARILTFDFSTELFSAPTAASPNTFFNNGTNCAQIIIQPSGTTWILYDHTAAGPASQTRYTTFSAGVWGSDNLLYAAIGGTSPPNQPVAALVMEVSGRFHGWICDADIAPGGNMYWKYFQISAAGVVGAVTTAFTINQSIQGQFFNGTHLAQIRGSQLFFPFSWTQADNNIVMWCLVGTTLAAPTWQALSCDPGLLALPQSDLGNQDYAERDGAAVLGIDGNLYVFFDVMDNFNSGTLANGGQVWYAQWNGVNFNTPVFFFDSIGATKFPNQTNPTGQATVFVVSMTPTQKSDGSWTLMVSTSFDLPQVGSSYNEVIFSGPTVITLTFNLHGATPGLMATNPPPGPPGPVINPTNCVNQV